ncbi:hypothetical protein ACFWGD_01270 [Corynebacterium sp. NPDC060344]|uniref:hypothetical protein n=1 Tax=Corynebacterium sp. NPDC060344 TaxID=3347101 RepID=UPI00364F4528
MDATIGDAGKTRDPHVPDRAQVAAARLIIKRDREGKGNIRVTDRIRRLAAYSGYDR